MPTGEIISAQYDWDVELSGGETHYHAFWTDNALNSRAQMAFCRRKPLEKKNKKRSYAIYFCWKHNVPQWIILLQHGDELDRDV